MRKTLALSLLAVMVLVFGSECQAAGDGSLRLKAVPFTDVQIDDVFWGPRIETNRVNTVWHDIKKCEETGRVDNFAKAGGLKEGTFKGIYFDDSDLYKVLEGAAYSLTTHPDKKLEEKVDEIIDIIASAQLDDGYLDTYYILTGLDKRWTNIRVMHELYCAGHMYEAAVAYYRATGKRKFLDVAIKNADHIGSIFGPGKRTDVPGHEEIELALVKLYEVTGMERFRDMATFFIDQRGRANGRKLYGEYNQDHKPVSEQTEIVGHAVRAMYLYAGAADVAGLTSDQQMKAALQKGMDNLWANMVGRKLYLTGGIGASHHGEAFGGDYFLPNDEAYAETCAAIGLDLWAHRLNLMYADASYFDVFERALYNGMLSGVSLDGMKFFYVNPLESDGAYTFNQGSAGRQSWYACSCCPSNVVRFLPSVPGYMYACDDDSVYVNLYAQSVGKATVAGQTVGLEQVTSYPWDGTVTLAVNPETAGEFEVCMRIPGWAQDKPVPSDLYSFVNDPGMAVVLKVNGKKVDVSKQDKGYVKIKRQWKKGDKVVLELPMPVQLVKAHEKVEADRGKVAIQRGPIVYCLEEKDNGAMVRHFYLDGGTFKIPYEKELLGGVTVIKGEAKTVNYEGDVETYAFTAIPYYAWNNRGKNQMAVWLADGKESAWIVPKQTIASGAQVSASHCNGADSVTALNDQVLPENSNDHTISRMTWWDHKGSEEWVAYAFNSPTTVSSVKVYWFDDAPGGGCRVPASWKVQYDEYGQWKDVQAKGAYAVKIDQFFELGFEPITTSQLRLVVDLQDGFSGGLLEWQVD